MDVNRENYDSSSINREEEDFDIKRGPWTIDEDLLLVNYIATHGEGRWSSLARSAGLKRTGKSCRLRWLNYLRPDVRRGNITLEEQLTILQLHSQWGNRWSKIAQHLPGRTDNEIKNYWRTRVQKHAKQLGCEVNSKLFRDTMKYLWMPRLMERIRSTTSCNTSTSTTITNHVNDNLVNITPRQGSHVSSSRSTNSSSAQVDPSYTSENSSTAVSFDEHQLSPVSDMQEESAVPLQLENNVNINTETSTAYVGYPDCLTSPTGYSYFNQNGLEFEQNNMWLGNEDFWENLWNVENMLFSK
ncbi:hypothetical protein AQUCO_07300028v1 [Aquilegia coerulea]|uniref:Uncharacterized protein n=1 Tax=Aquilegia coerulea TaxID=218851 RepID=A0A2G5C9W7_AQUCA|nr:hypothetical protein AQUCO_07300028v1 [Aquilegia coerulea]